GLIMKCSVRRTGLKPAPKGMDDHRPARAIGSGGVDIEVEAILAGLESITLRRPGWQGAADLRRRKPHSRGVHQPRMHHRNRGLEAQGPDGGLRISNAEETVALGRAQPAIGCRAAGDVDRCGHAAAGPSSRWQAAFWPEP